MMIIDRSKVALTDDELEQLFEAEFSVGLTVDDLTFYDRGEMDRIREARTAWTDRGRTKVDTAEMLDLDGVQATRGQRRQHLCGVVVGEFEAIYCG